MLTITVKRETRTCNLVKEIMVDSTKRQLTSVTKVRSFVILASYYQRLMKELSGIVPSMIAFVRRVKLEWPVKYNESF